MPEVTSVPEIQSAITDEVFYALGLYRRGFLRRYLGWVFWLPTRIFARYMAAVDEAVALGGPPTGCQKMLDLLGVRAQVQGRSNIPLEGPAIILANHPGAYDSMAICSLLPRRDLKAIVAKTHFYQTLPHIHPEFLYASEDRAESMLAIRGAVDHLLQGGILLQFGSGLIEPDPAFYPIGDAVFDRWSPSLEILFRKVPEMKVVPTIASGVLLERFMKHPLTKLRRDAMDKRRLAEFHQIIQQLMFPKTISASPSISFGKPFMLAEVAQESADRRLMPGVIAKMKAHLAEHLTWISPPHKND